MDSFPHKTPTTTGDHHQKKHNHNLSNSELMASAKLVASAAQSSFNNQSDKVDKGQVADAAGDLLGAASHYGKLEEKSFGKYVEQAEDYLHNYDSSHSATSTTATATAATTGHSSTKTGHSTTTHAAKDEDQDSGSGYGDYFKMAQGFLK